MLIVGAEVIAAFREGYRDEYFAKDLNDEDDKESVIDKAFEAIKEKIHEKWVQEIFPKSQTRNGWRIYKKYVR